MSDLDLSSDLNNLVIAREEIWNKYDRIIEEAKQIDRFNHFDSASLNEQFFQANEKLCPEKLPAIIDELKREEQTIIKAEKNIACYQQEIISIKQKQYCTLGGTGIAAAITLIVLL